MPESLSPYAADLTLALELADAADAITTRRFRAADLHVDTKPDLTPVSDADRSAEERIREIVAATRPADAVMGEEYGEGSGVGDRRWIVDPIDGTKNFVRRVPIWASLIALEDAGRMVVGVVSAPALGRRWWAARGAGAWAGPSGAGVPDGERITVSAVESLQDAFVSYASLGDWPAGTLDRLLSGAWRTRGLGDFWMHMLVAEGALDVAAEPEVYLWDVAAVQVIVEEAGGRFTDLSGTATAYGGSAVSSNGRLHDTALRLLSEPQ